MGERHEVSPDMFGWYSQKETPADPLFPCPSPDLARPGFGRLASGALPPAGLGWDHEHEDESAAIAPGSGPGAAPAGPPLAGLRSHRPDRDHGRRRGRGHGVGGGG